MPVQPTYPGVYIEEVPSGARPIVGVATSVAAFVGRTKKGSIDAAIRCFSFADFERKCGGLWNESELGHSVFQFFLNGGGEALICRVVSAHELATDPATAATATLGSGTTLNLVAANPGAWGSNLRAQHEIETLGETLADPSSFHLTVWEVDADGETVLQETFDNVSVDPASPRFVTRVLEQGSQLVRVSGSLPSARPDDPSTEEAFGGSPSDGSGEVDDDYTAATDLLEHADIFNLLVVPPPDRFSDTSTGVLTHGLALCERRRAMLLIDPPSQWGDYEAAANLSGGYSSFRRANAAFFYPRIMASDPLQEGRARLFAPCGAIAGVIARTDNTRGVWKAAAGTEARLRGVTDLEVPLSDGESGVLNPKGVNALRQFPIEGPVVWGSRTARGADVMASPWKYMAVRRTALFIEETLQRSTRWAVFEPNDEPLWAQLRKSIGTFMHDLFRQGAFAGSTAREAYSVACDTTTTTQADIDKGIVNIVVGFAPLKPAEFVVLKFQQTAGQ